MKKKVDDHRLMVKCCALYYEEGLTQAQISKELNLSRPTISRLLKEAKKVGVVQIKINSDYYSTYHKLEREIEKKLNLKEVVIVDDRNDPIRQKMLLAQAAAKYLERSLTGGDIVGVSMGKTLKHISKFVEYSQSEKMCFIPLIGGVGQVGIDYHSNQLVKDLADAFHSEYKFLHAPAYLSDVQIKENIIEDTSIKESMEMMNQITFAVIGIGATEDSGSTPMETGYFNLKKMNEVNAKGAVGDICLQFYNKDGETEPFECNKQILGLDIERLKQVAISVGVAGGIQKAEGILGAVRGKFINVLITNYSCCKKIEEMISDI